MSWFGPKLELTSVYACLHVCLNEIYHLCLPASGNAIQVQKENRVPRFRQAPCTPAASLGASRATAHNAPILIPSRQQRPRRADESRLACPAGLRARALPAHTRAPQEHANMRLASALSLRCPLPQSIPSFPQQPAPPSYYALNYSSRPETLYKSRKTHTPIHHALQCTPPFPISHPSYQLFEQLFQTLVA